MPISATVLELFWKNQEGADSAPPPAGRVFTVCILVSVLLQLSFIYFFTGALLIAHGKDEDDKEG